MTGAQGWQGMWVGSVRGCVRTCFNDREGDARGSSADSRGKKNATKQRRTMDSQIESFELMGQRTIDECERMYASCVTAGRSTKPKELARALCAAVTLMINDRTSSLIRQLGRSRYAAYATYTLSESVE